MCLPAGKGRIYCAYVLNHKMFCQKCAKLQKLVTNYEKT